jgi:hypothetical protein
VAQFLDSVQISGLELNDGINFAVPFPNLDDQAPAQLRIQKVAFGPPVYTGQLQDVKSITIRVNIIKPAATPDPLYLDFDAKLANLKVACDTRAQTSVPLRLQRRSQPAKIINGTAESFIVNRIERWVEIKFTVMDGVWLAETDTKIVAPVTTSGQVIKLTSNGTVDTFPTFTFTWNVPKGFSGATGNFYGTQIPITVTNSALAAVTRIPIEICGYTTAPTYTAVAGTSGTIPAQTLTVGVSVIRYRPDGSLGETDVVTQTVPVSANGNVTFTINTTTDAVQYGIYAGAPGSVKQQSVVLQPNPYTQTVTFNLTAVTTTGSALPTSNTTGWDTTSLVSSGKIKADGSDIRVLVGNVPAPRVVSGLNTPNTKVWALLNMGAQASQLVYLQYGNQNPSPQPAFALGDPIILDTDNSNNYKWAWNGTFYDYKYNTRPGSWQPVSSVGAGYGWKQDNNIVKRGSETSYATAVSVTFTNQEFSSGNTTGWTTTGTAAVDNTLPAPGATNVYSCLFTPNAPNQYLRNANPSVTVGLSYILDAWVWADTDQSFVVQVLDNSSSVLGFYYVAGSKAYQRVQILFSSTTAAISVNLLGLSGIGTARLTECFIYPAVDVSSRAPLIDPLTNQASVMGLLHSTVAVNNREAPLNGWELQHPAGITSVTHWGRTSLVSSDYLNANVLRLMAEDQAYPPAVIWGQPSLTTGGPVTYATSGSPRVDAILPPRQRVRFEINASVLAPVNTDGTFCAIEGVSLTFNPQYVVAVSFGKIQQFYDLSVTLTQATQGDGDALVIQTPLEPKSKLTIDCKNKQVLYTDPTGVQTIRTSALSTNNLRTFWMLLHAGDNYLTYVEDTVGGVQLQIDWHDAWL